MSRIRILPDILSNQIAAGEVVQRPVSVVKELVENSMDAGADRIMVEIESGGKSLIRVSDNGDGLARDEAVLALERYATSKIYTKDDLFSISTFGFRGEALPSIASVSKFSLVSRTRDSDTGTKVELAGGKLSNVTDTGAPPGTMVEVRQLFFNTPARRKFLKSENTESGHISDALAGLAMGNPQVGFRLVVNRRLIKNFPPGQTLFQRAQMVLGKDASDHLYEMQWPGLTAQNDSGDAQSDLAIHGVCANPSVSRSTAGRIYLFVNRRLVYDRGLIAAMFQGYRGRIMKGRYPVGAVCVVLPCDQVDVNVHPAKREIKFISPAPVYHALARAVSDALTRGQEDKMSYSRAFVQERHPAALVQKKFETDGLPPKKETPDLFGAALPKAPPPIYIPGDDIHQTRQVHESLQEFAPPYIQPEPEFEEDSASTFNEQKRLEPKGRMPEAAHGQADSPAGSEAFLNSSSPLRVVGQVLNTYIVVEKEGHLILVDQHAAHERIVFEELERRYRSLDVQSQTLAVPEVLDLTHQEAVLLETIVDELAALGIGIEPFGGTSFVIKSVPVLVEGKQVGKMVQDMVEKISRDNGTGLKDQWLETCLSTMACHRAVRANQTMNAQEMTALIETLFLCRNPMHCPHGRPIIVSFDARRLEKLFKRLV